MISILALFFLFFLFEDLSIRTSPPDKELSNSSNSAPRGRSFLDSTVTKCSGRSFTSANKNKEGIKRILILIRWYLIWTVYFTNTAWWKMIDERWNMKDLDCCFTYRSFLAYWQHLVLYWSSASHQLRLFQLTASLARICHSRLYFWRILLAVGACLKKN